MRCRRCRGSRPVRGSSSTSTCGSCTIACATFTRCRIPFEYDATYVGCRPRRGRPRATRAVAASRRIVQLLQTGREPDELEGRQRLEQCVLLGDQTDLARAARDRGAGRARARGPQPCEGGVSPAIIRSIVDLPAPLGPSSAVTPRPTWKDTSDTATTSVEPLRHTVDGDDRVGAVVAAPRSAAGHRVTSIRR